MSEASTEMRMWIVASIKRILAGEDFTDADWEAQPDAPSTEVALRKALFPGIKSSDGDPEFFALQALRWWADDADIRAQDTSYGEMRKQQLRRFLEAMKV